VKWLCCKAWSFFPASNFVFLGKKKKAIKVWNEMTWKCSFRGELFLNWVHHLSVLLLINTERLFYKDPERFNSINTPMAPWLMKHGTKNKGFVEQTCDMSSVHLWFQNEKQQQHIVNVCTKGLFPPQPIITSGFNNKL